MLLLSVQLCGGLTQEISTNYLEAPILRSSEAIVLEHEAGKLKSFKHEYEKPHLG